MMASGLLVKLGYLNFFLAFVLLMTGDLAGDVMWYGIGYFFGMRFVKKFGKYFGLTEQNVEKVQTIFNRHDAKIVFISKITMGLGFALATLIAAGTVKIKFKRFVFWNAMGGLVWTSALMFIGFAFGNFYLKVSDILGRINTIALFAAIFIVVVSILRYILSKILAKKIL